MTDVWTGLLGRTGSGHHSIAKRAWCSDCSEWCYRKAWCVCCRRWQLAIIRDLALAREREDARPEAVERLRDLIESTHHD